MVLDPIIITVIRSDNQNISLHGRPTSVQPFGITELVGFEFPQVEVFTAAKGLGDGVFFTGQRLNGRTVEIHLKQNERYPQDFFDGWNNIKAFFNPRFTYNLMVDNYTQTPTVRRWLLDCRILAADYPHIDASDTNPEFVIQMMSPEPGFAHFYDEALTFTDNVEQTFSYTGDLETFVQVELTATTAGGGTLAEVTVNGATWTLAPSYYIPVGSVLLLNPEDGTYEYNGHVDGFFIPSEATAVYQNWRTNLGTNANTIKIHQPDVARFTAKLVYNARYLGI